MATKLIVYTCAVPRIWSNSSWFPGSLFCYTEVTWSLLKVWKLVCLRIVEINSSHKPVLLYYNLILKGNGEICMGPGSRLFLIYIQADQLAKGRLCWGMSDVAHSLEMFRTKVQVISRHSSIGSVVAEASRCHGKKSWFCVPLTPTHPSYSDISSCSCATLDECPEPCSFLP